MTLSCGQIGAFRNPFKIHTAMFIFAFKAAGRWFESSRPLQKSEDVAQLIEQRIIVVWPLGSC